MLTPEDRGSYLKRYSARLREYGRDPRTLGWSGGVSRQFTRFDASLKIFGRIDKPVASLLDVGCGFGDLGLYISQLGFPHKYTGVDINPDLLDVARRDNPRGRFVLGDFHEGDLGLGDHDVCIAIGIFGAKLEIEDQVTYVYKSLERLLEISNYGISVDFMTDRVDWQHPEGFHLAPEKAIELAYSLSSKFAVIHDYLPYEYTLHILKDEM